MTKISVIIPVYNKEKYLKKTIQSVLNQSFKDFELILINDGSTDNSAEILNSFEDRRISLYHQENKGVSYTRNKAANLAKSEILAFMDADDYWFSNHLETIINLSTKFPDATFFGTAYNIKYKGGLIKKFIVKIDDNNDIEITKFYKYYKGSPIFYTSNFAVKRDVFLDEGGFREDIHSEDTELFYRLGYKYKLAYSPKITMEHINNSENSLFANYKTDKKVLLLDALEKYEKKDIKLKAVLDLHRFAWIMEYILSGEKEKVDRLLKQIDPRNLNMKQKLILKFPANAIILSKKLQKYLIGKGIYFSPFTKS